MGVVPHKPHALGVHASRDLHAVRAAAHRLDLGKTMLRHQRRKGVDLHSRSVDPMFVDPANGDYRVRDGSEALKLGFKNFDVSGAGLLPDFPEK